MSSSEVLLSNLDLHQEKEAVLIRVHLAGAVKSPGLYDVPVGTRAHELIELSGGFLESAQLDKVNLAAFVQDGDRVYVPAMKMKKSTAENPVFINRANQKELMALHGVGESLSAEILRYREENGPFKSLEELIAVKGIGPKLIKKNERLIRLD